MVRFTRCLEIPPTDLPPMKKPLLLIPLLLAVIIFGSSAYKAQAAPALTPSEVIQKINGYRTANGLNALQVNQTLMVVAQGQSDYQASIGTVTHDGPGGSRPKDRLYAAGYGGGKVIFASEIIYGGTGATPSVALTWWKGSPIHNTVMLTSTYQEIGVGVATDGTWTYFTALLAYVSGTTYTPPDDDGTNGENEGPNSGNVGPVIIPVIKSTPRKDGAIIHTIRTGQALWTVSAVYGVHVSYLRELNNLEEGAILHAGDKIVVRPSNTPVSPATQTPTPKPTRKPTLQAANTLPATTLISTNLPKTAKINQPAAAEETSGNPAVKTMIILAFIIIFMVLVGSMFFQKPPQRSNFDDEIQ